MTNSKKIDFMTARNLYEDVITQNTVDPSQKPAITLDNESSIFYYMTVTTEWDHEIRINKYNGEVAIKHPASGEYVKMFKLF